MTDYIGNYKNRPRRVVFYGRVSTEHEEQLSALGNQMEWYTDLALRNPNWTVVAQYIDEGITGTQMKKRPSFISPPADYRLIIRKLDELQETMDALVEENPIKRDAMKLYITLQNVASTADVLRRAVMPFVSRREKK